MGLKTLCENEKNAGFQHFLLFAQCLQNPASSGSSELGNLFQNVKALELTIQLLFQNGLYKGESAQNVQL